MKFVIIKYLFQYIVITLIQYYYFCNLNINMRIKYTCIGICLCINVLKIVCIVVLISINFNSNHFLHTFLECEDEKFACRNGYRNHGSTCIDQSLVCNRVCDCKESCEDEMRCSYKDAENELVAASSRQKPGNFFVIVILLHITRVS